MPTVTQNPMVSGDVYGEGAPDYANFIANSATDQVFAFEPALKALAPLRGKTVLDYGCGPGVFSQQMATEGAKVVGVDIEADAINLARKQVRPSRGTMEFHHVASGDLGRFPPKAFDAATANFVFCTIGDRSVIVHILNGIRACLKPGGKLFISDQHWERSNGREFINIKLTATQDQRPGAPRLTIAKGSDGKPDMTLQDYYWPLSEYRAMLQEAGFAIIAVEEPIATEMNHPWLDEVTHPPTLLITAQLPLENAR